MQLLHYTKTWILKACKAEHLRKQDTAHHNLISTRIDSQHNAHVPAKQSLCK